MDFLQQFNVGKQQAVNLSAGASIVDVIAAPTGKRIVVTYMYLEAGAAIDVFFSSAAAAITGNIALGTTGIPFSNSGAPILRTVSVGDALRVTRSASQELDGWIEYVELDQ